MLLKDHSLGDHGAARMAVFRVDGGNVEERGDWLAVEEPLEIQLGYERRGWRVHKSVSVTMRTPGQDRELAAGFLFTESILSNASQIESVARPSEADNIVRVELRSGVQVDLRRLERHFYTTSSCGVCGKTSIEALGLSLHRELHAAGPVFDPEVIHRMPDTLRSSQSVFDRTGGLHAAALFDARGRLLDQREDVGRHNAVDKLIGAQLLAGKEFPLDKVLLFVSGRASFELMQKAFAAGIPILAAVGAPSSLAVELARRYGATLLGFVRSGRFNIYSGEQRILGASGCVSAAAIVPDGRAEVVRPTNPENQQLFRHE